MKLTKEEVVVIVASLEMSATSYDRQSNRLTVEGAKVAVKRQAQVMKDLALKLQGVKASEPLDF